MTGRQDPFQQAMNQGHSAAWDQMWDRAAQFYRQALEEFPDHPQALTNLGLALFELQDYDQALEVYQRAAKVSPDDPLPMEKVAQLYERVGNLEFASLAALRTAEIYLKNRDVNKAIENWQRVTRLNPENMQAHTRLAMVYERLGEKQKAVGEYLAVASLLQASGQLETAVKAVNQAMLVLPNSEEAIQALTLLRDGHQLPKPARPRGGTAPLRMAQVRKLESPKADNPAEGGDDPVTQGRRVALTALAGMLFEGSEDSSDDVLGRRGLQSLVKGSSPTGRQVDRNSIILHLSQVVDLQTNGQSSQAADELQQAIEAGLEHPAAYYDLGFLKAESEEYPQALQALKIATKEDDLALGAHLLMAELLSRTGQMKEASIEYMEALKWADAEVVGGSEAADLRQLYDPLVEDLRNESDPELQERLCTNISGMLKRSDWRAHLSRAREQLPARRKDSPPIPLAEILTQARSSKVLESLSIISELASQGYLRTAMEEAFYALQQAPTYLPLHSYMGELLLKQDRQAEAIAKFQAVARVYSIRGEVPRAVELYRRIIELAPMDMNTRSRLIELLASSGKTEAAIQDYLQLSDMYYSLADLEMVRKTLSEALRMTQQAKVDRSWRVKVLHRMADIDLQSLEWRQAIRVFEQIRTLQPEDEPARTNLIELNFRFGQEEKALAELDNYITYLIGAGQRARAIPFVEGLLKENQDRPSVRRRLAELYRQSGQVEKAVAEFDAVGEALLQAGDRAAAAQMIEAIVALNPTNKADYEELLAQIRS